MQNDISRKMAFNTLNVMFSCALSALLFVPSYSANAEEASKTTWGLGLAAQLRQHAYIDYDNDTQLLPNIYIENSWMKLAGPDLDFKLGHMGDLSFTLRTKFELGDGYESSDSYIFRGMEDRDASIWIGPSMNWDTTFVDVSLELLTDAMGNSDGQQATIDFSKEFSLSQHITIEPNIGVTWLSDNYVDYYYGVATDEVLSYRSAYEGEATQVVNAGLNLTYSFDKNQSVMLRAEVKSYGSEIKDSPLIDDSTSASLTFGYLYMFD